MISPLIANLLAAGVVGVLLVALVVRIVVALRRMPLNPVQSILWAINYMVARVLWRAKIEGRVSVPPGQGAVIVCNHRGPIDPAFVAMATQRVVHWMVAKEFWANPIFGWFFRQTESIPVGRAGVDTAATRMAIRFASEGDLVGLFIEGRINTSDDLLMPGRPGAALIALKARVPVIPCYLSGTLHTTNPVEPLYTPANARLKIGQPIDLSAYYDRESEREVLEALTKQFLHEIAKLAGQPDFEPKLAGRFYRPDMANREASNGE